MTVRGCHGSYNDVPLSNGNCSFSSLIQSNHALKYPTIREQFREEGVEERICTSSKLYHYLQGSGDHFLWKFYLVVDGGYYKQGVVK